MKINTSLKIFLTSGITLTVKEDEKIKEYPSIYELFLALKKATAEKKAIEFNVEINHTFVDEKTKKNKKQKVSHKYFIPYDRISWFMIEEG